VVPGWWDATLVSLEATGEQARVNQGTIVKNHTVAASQSRECQMLHFGRNHGSLAEME
jgi:hypothetical protein